MNEKIKPQHRERDAYVYVRQSTRHQIREHPESRKRQYDLDGRAQQLGFDRVVVIDEDLGRSGTGKVERPGFGRLLAAVCEGKVGAVLALEASRLARNNRDWHHLIDLCAMTETLVVDEDGIYDPRLANDRLLLGVKGSMAEFELSLLRQRAQEALRGMIQRGLVLWEVPVGYIRTEDNRIEKNPDRQVQEAVRGVLAKFWKLGSARQVLLWYVQERIPLPSTVPGTNGREVTWQIPCYKRIYNMLANPAYSGTYVHGRRGSRTRMEGDRARKSYGHELPIEEWPTVIHNHHPGYISWEQFLRIQKQLEENVHKDHHGGRGAAKRGPALLSGLLRCARCGRKLHVAYSGKARAARYHCVGGAINHGMAKCITTGSWRLDQAVSDAVLQAVQPLGIEAALQAVTAAEHADAEKRGALELALEKARYDADRARRQFDAVEPENRLVATELESRWNEALRHVAELESRLVEVGAPRGVSVEEQRRLLELGADLQSLWTHPAASIILKKRILRTVLEEIVLDVLDDPRELLLRLHWVGGVHTELRVARAKPGERRTCTDLQVIDLVRELTKVCDDKTIASILNRLGYRTGPGNTWTEMRLYNLRRNHEIPEGQRDNRDWLTLREAAKELGISHRVVERLVRQKILPAKQVVVYAPWVIRREDLALPGVQAVARAILKHQKPPRTAPGQRELPFK
jgi:DNA invertase Pin-like site-specific DNA recombinase